MIRDRNIDWKRKRIHLEPLTGMGWTTAGTVPVGLHTGAPVFAELSTFGFGAVKFEAAGDEWVQLWQLPKDCDVSKPIRFRVVWSTESTTAADKATFKLTYKAVADGEALAAANTALDTTIAQDTWGATAAYTIARTAWGQIAADTLSEGDLLVLETEIDATDVDIANEYIYFLGLEIEYTPKKTKGTGITAEPTE